MLANAKKTLVLPGRKTSLIGGTGARIENMLARRASKYGLARARTLTCFVEIEMVSCLCENQSLKKLYDYTLSLRFLPPLSRFR